MFILSHCFTDQVCLVYKQKTKTKQNLFFLPMALQIQPKASKIKLCFFIIIHYLQMWLDVVHYSTDGSPGSPLAMGPLITNSLIVQRTKQNLFCSPAAICSYYLYCRTQTSVFISHKNRSASYEAATFLPSSGSSCTLFLKFKTRPLVPEVKKYTSPKNFQLSLYSRSLLRTTLR